MRYDWLKNRLEGHFKTLGHLAKRPSHAEHETQREFTNFLFTYLEIPRYRLILRIRGAWMITAAQELHKDCCDIKD